MDVFCIKDIFFCIIRLFSGNPNSKTVMDGDWDGRGMDNFSADGIIVCGAACFNSNTWKTAGESVDIL